MFYKIGNGRVVHNGSVFVFVLFVLWQFVVGILVICCGHFGNLSAMFWQSVSSRRGPIYRARIYENTHKMGEENVRALK